MIKDYRVILNGATIPGVREIVVTIETRPDNKGLQREQNAAATITIVRDASDMAIVDLFEMATSKDKRKTNISQGSLEFHGDNPEDIYSFTIQQGSISDWRLDSPTSPTAPTLESIVLDVKEVEYRGIGTSAKFTAGKFE